MYAVYDTLNCVIHKEVVMEEGKSEGLCDARTAYRINRIETEKERQKKKYEDKQDSTDWLSIIETEEKNGY